jgi:DNA-binding NarL/FixJ family response regulator
MKTTVLIADDHSVVRSGLKLVLESSGEFEIVAEAADGGELPALVETHSPDLLIVDISMPVVNGIDAVRVLRARHPDLKILALTVHADEEYIFQMLKAGANGYVLKSAGKDEIFHAAASVLSGATFFSPTVSDIVVQGFIERAGAESRSPAAAPPEARPDSLPLTRREIEVLRLIAQGMTNRQIGETLFISVRTVNTHRTNLMQKLDLHDTAALVRCAIAHGLLSAENGEDGSETATVV